MVYRLIVAAGLLLSLGLGSVLTAEAGPGQPGQSCENLGTLVKMPNGFTTTGFAGAQIVYAGSPGTPSLANGNVHAVSQYDVACTTGR